jgi:tetratricopeptide (TPR) repeat protein
MSKHIFISGLTFVSILIATASDTHAKLAPNANSLTIQQLDRSIPQQSSRHPQIASAGDRSMKYVEMGMAAQKEGDEKQALEYYYQAVKIDQTNAVAFLLAGNLLGDTEDGIACVKAAGVLFQVQENQEGYELAMTWLKEHGVESL